MLIFLKITAWIAVVLWIFEMRGIFQDKNSSLPFKFLMALIFSASTVLYVYAYRCTFNENLSTINWFTKVMIILVAVIYTEMKALNTWMLNKPR